jgi:hypothetical protein
MNRTQALVAICLLLGGCGSCQRSEEPAGTGSGAAAPTAAVQPARQATPGKIQVAPLQPTVASREAGAARPAEGGAPAAPMQPQAGAPPEAPEEDEGDCIVVADANPDYGPPPLAVVFSAEAECSAGEPTYKWDFGDGSAASSEMNPSHTYPKPGDYTASVTVTGPNGATAADEIDITVEEGEAESQ